MTIEIVCDCSEGDGLSWIYAQNISQKYWWRRYLYGQWDSDRFAAKLREYSPILSGALFGAAWWIIVDAITYSKAVLGEGFPWTFVLPGCVATLAHICMNVVSREELVEISEQSSYEEGVGTRARCWLFFSYMVAFGSIAGAGAVLLKTTGQKENIQVGVAGLVQTGLIITSGLLLWGFRTPADDSFSLTY